MHVFREFCETLYILFLLELLKFIMQNCYHPSRTYRANEQTHTYTHTHTMHVFQVEYINNPNAIFVCRMMRLTFVDTDLLLFSEAFQLSVCRVSRDHEINELFYQIVNYGNMECVWDSLLNAYLSCRRLPTLIHPPAWENRILETMSSL